MKTARDCTLPSGGFEDGSRRRTLNQSQVRAANLGINPEGIVSSARIARTCRRLPAVPIARRKRQPARVESIADKAVH